MIGIADIGALTASKTAGFAVVQRQPAIDVIRSTSKIESICLRRVAFDA